MKKKYLRSISILLAGFLIYSVFLSVERHFSRSYFHARTASTDLRDENIEGLRLYDDITSSGFGSIDQSQKTRDVAGYDYYFLSKNVEVASKHNKITRFIVSDRHMKTAKGIGVGHTKDEVMNAYGKNDYVRSEQGVEIIGYVDKETKTSIEFWLVDDVVDVYRYDVASME